jgi:hypothetical protein
MTEHTMAPWKATWNNKLGRWSIHHMQWCERGDTSIIATVLTSLDAEADKANARVIAAAPDLYECLRLDWLLREVEYDVAYDAFLKAGWDKKLDMGAWLDNKKSEAIAKARGYYDTH